MKWQAISYFQPVRLCLVVWAFGGLGVWVFFGGLVGHVRLVRRVRRCVGGAIGESNNSFTRQLT